MRIGIDIDDTITNTTSLMDEYAKRYDNTVKINNNEYYMKDRYNWTFQKVESFWKQCIEDILSNVSTKEDAVKYINKLYDEENDIYLITARSSRYSVNVPEITTNYMDKLGIKYNYLIMNSWDKNRVCLDHKIDIMIDDSPKHASECAEDNIEFIIMDNEYNKDVDVTRAHNWKEVYEIINRR